MILALILVCIAVIILLIATFVLSALVVDGNATIRALQEDLSRKETAFCRMQDLVYKKFNYRLPMSDRYLSIEEILLEKETKAGEQ